MWDALLQVRGLIPSNTLLELATKKFTEPQLISYSPGDLSQEVLFPCDPTNLPDLHTVQPTTTFT